MIKTISQAREIFDSCFCPVCGEKMLSAPSGFCCPSHRLTIRSEASPQVIDLADAAKEILSLPLAIPIRGLKTRCLFVIHQMDGIYRCHSEGDTRAVRAGLLGLEVRSFFRVRKTPAKSDPDRAAWNAAQGQARKLERLPLFD